MTANLKPISEVLVPIDFTEVCQEALEYAMRLVGPSGSRLHLLHVVDDPMLISRTTDESFRDEHANKMAMKFIDLVTPEQREGFNAVMSIRFGTAYHEIEQYALEKEIELIVMGNTPRSTIANALLGSVTSHLIRNAKCPVLTVTRRESP